MFTARQALLYLMEEGLVSVRSAMRDDIRVVRSSRRHQNFRVTRDGSEAFFLKQGAGQRSFGSVGHEAAMLRALHENVACRDLARVLPRFYRYSGHLDMLTTELLPDAEDLRASFSRKGRVSMAQADALGRAVAALHSLPSGVLTRLQVPSGAVHPPPWALSLALPRLAALAEMSRAGRDLIRIVQKYGEFERAFERLRRDWRTDALIHYDLKWDNLLVVKGRESGRDRLVLVDWELAGAGDRRWDIGGILHEFLACWLTSLPVTEDGPRIVSLRREGHPIAAMRPAIRRFWNAYSACMESGGVTAAGFLEQSIRFAAVRLVQTSFELSQNAGDLPGAVVYFLQCGLNMLARPERAATDLFGLGPGGTAA
jgi:Phosphotransferase enzyme family